MTSSLLPALLALAPVGMSISACGDDSTPPDPATPSHDAGAEATTPSCNDGAPCPAGEICDPITLGCVCAAGTHRCEGACVNDDSVDHCGSSCTPCPVDPNGEATCNGVACGIECQAGFLLCGGMCAACPDPVGVQAFGCDGSACVASACEQGFEPCAVACCPVDTGLVHLNSGGSSPSIAIDSLGNPHVSFLADHYSLMYAHRENRVWSVSPISDGANAYATAIAMDASDSPIIAFSANYALKVARLIGGTWEYETIYSSARGYGPELNMTALVLDQAQQPHVASSQIYHESGTYNSYMLHIDWDGSDWQHEHIEDSLDNRYSLPSIAVDSHDALHVTWVSYYDGALRYATNGSGSWVREIASASGTCCDEAYIALDPSNAPFIAFEQDGGAYAIADRSTGSWSENAIQTGVHTVGNLAFDRNQGLHYVLRNENGELMYGSPNGSSWEQTSIAPDAAQFMMALDATDGAHFIYTTADALRYAQR